LSSVENLVKTCFESTKNLGCQFSVKKDKTIKKEKIKKKIKKILKKKRYLDFCYIHEKCSMSILSLKKWLNFQKKL